MSLHHAMKFTRIGFISSPSYATSVTSEKTQKWRNTKEEMKEKKDFSARVTQLPPSRRLETSANRVRSRLRDCKKHLSCVTKSSKGGHSFNPGVKDIHSLALLHALYPTWSQTSWLPVLHRPHTPLPLSQSHLKGHLSLHFTVFLFLGWNRSPPKNPTQSEVAKLSR